MGCINITQMKKSACIAANQLTAMGAFKHLHANIFMEAAAENANIAAK
jgi:hypothetical protein